MGSSETVFDLSHRIENGMPCYPGDVQPHLDTSSRGEPPWQLSQLCLGSHTGTHIDAPFHLITEGRTIDKYPSSRFLVPGVVACLSSLSDDQPIEATQLAESLSRLPQGGALVIRTDWSRYWEEARYFRHPFLSREAAEAVVQAGAGLVAADLPSVDSATQGTWHAHDVLLGNDVLIAENLTGLAQLDPHEVYWFSFLPLRLARLDGSPIRAVAWRGAVEHPDWRGTDPRW